MRHILSRRASGKHRSSSRRQERNMAATTGNITDVGGGSGVVAAVGGGGGGGGGSSGGVNTPSSPSSPVPDWTGDPVPLKEFASKKKVPGFARVVKGSYMTIGSSKFSLQKQHHEIYVHSVKMGVKVLAHCLRRVDMPGPRRGQTYSRLCAMDQRLTVPISYQGWFELLSEDGRSARPIASVPELAKVFPQRCLVRENIKGYISAGEGPLTFDKTKIIPAGEQLRLCRDVTLPTTSPSQGAKVKLLHCVDTKGDNVYLSFDQKGLFTPIAGDNDFTGLFNIRDIVRRFRLPLTVKLTHGVRPRVGDNKFSGLVRLDWVYTEETAFVCPVEKNHVRLLPVPCDVHLQLVAASNQEEMTASEMFKSMQAKCTRMVSNYNNTLHLIVTLPESVMKTQHRSARASNIFSAPLRPEEDGVGTPKGGRVKRSKSREDILMAEIDDLYAYVRDGGTPPKPKFQYDSDEESYWEEPAYEPLDDFRARLKAIESGQKVSFHEKYRPADPKQLRDLVGGTGAPTVAAQPPQAGPAGLGDATSEGVYGVMSSSSNGAREESGSVEEDPPPLPPRPPEMVAPVTTASPINNVSTIVTTTTSSTSPSATPKKSASTHVRRGSAPLASTSQLSIHQTPVHRDPPPLDASPSKHSLGSSSTNKDSSAEAVKLTQFTTTIDLNSKDASVSQSKNPRSRTVSRSDSEPSITVPSSAEFPTTAAQARDSALHRQQSQATGPDGKPDWRERLRRFNALDGGKEKECSSSSSGSAGDQQKGVARRMARDFKDSDISSRTKATSSGSSGGRGVRKRMQTLYL